MDNPILNLKTLIANGEISKAINGLLELVQDSKEQNRLESEVILLSLRNNQLEKGIRTRTISKDNEDVSRNEICISFLEILNEYSNPKKLNDSFDIPKDSGSESTVKNVITGSTINSGTIRVGDIIHNSKSDKKLGEDKD